MGHSWVLPAVSARERALLATAELWSDRGYAGLDRGTICARAGIEPSSFAALFPDVGTAARAALEVPISAMVSLVGKQFSPDRPEPESCMAGIVAILKSMGANPAYAHVVYVGRRQASVPEQVNSVATTAGGFMVAMLERLRESSAVRAQPSCTGLGALGAAEALVRREVLAGRADRLPSTAPSVVYGATAPFVGQKEGVRLARLSEQVAQDLER